ncbi:ATPase [Streptomyces sp. CB02488]|uniref:ATP-binding protein n=1 Tax=Streptomyces sp. CB02488 TaxID=1703920 RepID=UPI00093934B7|nr:ATP-binding protein [Streptomyces sp. CB02488]OKK11265.1 ATPase [Streptomyces sp. CB02488]
MSTTRQHPPGDLGREPEGAGVGAHANAGPGADAGPGASSDGPAGPGERQWRTLSLRQVSGIVPTARDFARTALQEWGWLPASTADRRAAAEDVLLVVSELVTNACLHAEGPDELRIGRTSKALRVEVVDGGAGQPAPRTPHRAGRPGGHGMFIVQRLCLDWGVVRVPGEPGKTVWAELAAPV